MRFFRLITITVLLVTCMVLGSACAGAKGEQGPEGETGAAGVGVENIVNNGDGTFTVNLTNGDSYTTDNLTGPQGERGDKGDSGLPGAGVAWEGEWSNATTYSLNDAVGYQGSSYISRQNANTNHVPTDAVWWDPWVEKGDTGSAGADGRDGAPGPNMIVAAGNIDSDLTIHQGYNVTSVTWYVDRYEITLTGINYNRDRYVTVVTPVGAKRSVFTSSGSGKLYVYMWNNLGEAAQDQFHFVVLDTVLA